MTRISRMSLFSTAILLAITQSLVAQTAPAGAVSPKAADVPVTRVVLFSSGVGYFEHTGKVTGTVTTELQFETAQINDVLKSLVAFDRSGGTVGSITYPANDPVNRTLRSFQVNLSGDPPMASILKQIRGARVQVALGDESIAGTILGVEQKERAVGRPDSEKVISAWFLNLVTDGGIRSVALDEIKKLDIQDEKIKREMAQALAALVQARDQSKKTVTIHFDAKAGAAPAERAVGLGYLVETPVWKTTYRLLLPDPSSKSPAELQAWAIVENQTDNDWNDITLSLVGGRPISFIQLLYQPLYVARPVVSPDVIGSVVPQTYDNGITVNGAVLANEALSPRINLQSLTQNTKTQQFSSGGGGFGGGGGGQGLFQNSGGTASVTGGVQVPETPMSDFTQGISAIADATKIGEMFHYTVEKVSLPRQQSSMIPIIAEGLSVDRLSIYSPSVSAKYAMRGLRLHNSSTKYLLGGPITVMDTVKEGHSYAGDAKIEDIPPGQTRLLSYALDQESVIQISPDKGDETLLTGSINKGVLLLRYRSQMQREYTLQNKSDSAKTIIIEHPLAPGFDLKEPAQPLEKTDTVYRFEVKLTGKETKSLHILLEQPRLEQLSLTSLESDPLFFYIKQSSIPARVREVLQNIATRRAAMAEIQRQISLRTAERTLILQEQANIRENIRVLPANSKSQEDAVKELTTRDQDLKTVNQSIKDFQSSLESARTELAKYLDTTAVE